VRVVDYAVDDGRDVLTDGDDEPARWQLVCAQVNLAALTGPAVSTRTPPENISKPCPICIVAWAIISAIILWWRLSEPPRESTSMTTKTRKEIAAEIGVTEEQLNAVFDALDELDPKERAQLIKAAHDLEKFARETGMTVEELCRTASTRQH
jgi:hypothetical protein